MTSMPDIAATGGGSRCGQAFSRSCCSADKDNCAMLGKSKSSSSKKVIHFPRAASTAILRAAAPPRFCSNRIILS